MIKEQRKYEYIKIAFLIRNIQSLKLKRKNNRRKHRIQSIVFSEV